MKVTVKAQIDISKHMKKIRNDDFWTFSATEWWRLITPFVPMDTGTLSETVRIGPKEIEYYAPYASRVYNNNFNFRKDKHPKASSKWDKAAEPTQKQKLIDAMQAYIDSGRLNLNG